MGSVHALVHTSLNLIERLDADDRRVASGAGLDPPLRNGDETSIDVLAEKSRDRLPANLSGGRVLREIKLGFEEAEQLGLRRKTPRRVSLQCLLHDRSQLLVEDEHLAAAGSLHVAITDRLPETPESLFDARAHFLDDLAAILFALKLALRSEDGFDELPFGRVLEIEVKAFARRIPARHFPAQREMEFRVTRIALQVVEYDDIIFVGMVIEIAEQCDHALALHEIAAAAHVIGKDRFDLVTALDGVEAAAVLLGLQARAFVRLTTSRDAAINQRLLGFGISSNVTFHALPPAFGNAPASNAAPTN